MPVTVVFVIEEEALKAKPNLLLTWTVVLTTIGLVVLPIGLSGLKGEVGRWHLAAAANAIELGDGDPLPALARASESIADLESSYDYWLLKAKQALLEEPESLPELVAQAKARTPRYRSLGRYISLQLSRKPFEFSRISVAIQEMILTPSARALPANLNHLAYLRALAGVELDMALEDINRALEAYPKNSALRDTRGWVLFQMGKPLEALEDADFAVAQLEEELEQQQASFLDSWLNAFTTTGGEPSEERATEESLADKRPLTREEAGELLWTRGVLRYHRGRILDALGRDAEAQEDWRWLEEHRLPLDGSLN